MVKGVTEEANAMVSEACYKTSGIVKGFALGMDFYFTQGKDGQAVTKGLESKFAKKISKLAEDLDIGLHDLIEIEAVFSKISKEVSA